MPGLLSALPLGGLENHRGPRPASAPRPGPHPFLQRPPAAIEGGGIGQPDLPVGDLARLVVGGGRDDPQALGGKQPQRPSQANAKPPRARAQARLPSKPSSQASRPSTKAVPRGEISAITDLVSSMPWLGGEPGMAGAQAQPRCQNCDSLDRFFHARAPGPPRPWRRRA